MTCILFKPAPGCGVTLSNVVVEFSHMHARKKMCDIYEEGIDTTWHKRLLKNPNLWNGMKFRVDKIITNSIDNNKTSLVLNIGMTDYKDFIGTNYAENAEILKSIGITDHSNEHAYLANPLGVGAVVISSDRQIVLIRKSVHCGECAGLLDIPGGHPEPEMIFKEKSKEDIFRNKLENLEEINSKIGLEIFQSIIREVRDEINIPVSCLQQPLLIGIAGNKTSHDRPTAEFLIQCSLDSTTIKDLYNKQTQTESYESTELLMLDCKQLEDIQSISVWEEMTPSAQAAIMLYLNYLK